MQLQIKGHRSFISSFGLKLYGIPFIDVLEFTSWSQTSPVKEDIVPAVVGGNEAESLISDYLFNRSCHGLNPPRFSILATPIPFSQSVQDLLARISRQPTAAGAHLPEPTALRSDKGLALKVRPTVNNHGRVG